MRFIRWGGIRFEITGCKAPREKSAMVNSPALPADLAHLALPTAHFLARGRWRGGGLGLWPGRHSRLLKGLERLEIILVLKSLKRVGGVTQVPGVRTSHHRANSDSCKSELHCECLSVKVQRTLMLSARCYLFYAITLIGMGWYSRLCAVFEIKPCIACRSSFNRAISLLLGSLSR